VSCTALRCAAPPRTGNFLRNRTLEQRRSPSNVRERQGWLANVCPALAIACRGVVAASVENSSR
jgi:hypothetical protein